ncbi:glutaredoxin family protein [Cryobacterium cryoconiti]|nr:glutaredoxin family protein [Cryobacterium cryoconiti]
MTDMTDTLTPTVTVYSKDDCRQCDATKRWLAARDVPFTVVDFLADEKNIEAAKALGYQEAPVVVVSFGVIGDEVHWSGFNPIELGKYLSVTVAA